MYKIFIYLEKNIQGKARCFFLNDRWCILMQFVFKMYLKNNIFLIYEILVSYKVLSKLHSPTNYYKLLPENKQSRKKFLLLFKLLKQALSLFPYIQIIFVNIFLKKKFLSSSNFYFRHYTIYCFFYSSFDTQNKRKWKKKKNIRKGALSRLNKGYKIFLQF